MAASSRPTRNCQFFKTKRCKFEFLGMCAKGPQCPFAHGSTELRPLPDLRCTKMCRELLQSGRCNSSNCAYAHSREEVRALGDRQTTARRTKTEGRKPNAASTHSATPAPASGAVVPTAAAAAEAASAAAASAAFAPPLAGKGAWHTGQQRKGAERHPGHATQEAVYTPGASLSLVSGQGSQGQDAWPRAAASSGPTGNVPYPSGLTAGWLQRHCEQAPSHLLSEFPAGPAYIPVRPAIAEAGLSTESVVVEHALAAASAQSWASGSSGPAPRPHPASGSGTARREASTLGTEQGATPMDEELSGSDMWPPWSSWSPWGGSWDSQAAGSQGSYSAALSGGSIDVNQQEGGAWSQDWSGLLRASSGLDSKAPKAPMRPVRSSQTTLCTLTDEDGP
mmetsp:Transcript_58553/g.116102  ORF Transcript_58553/g.116102 Transcript_58553/m.116102 type:complete len:394 (-) Transcript_58553:57-1238(-)